MRCPSCGTTYGPDAKFCTKDGTRLQEVATKPTPTDNRGTVGRGPAVVSGPSAKKGLSFENMVGQLLDSRYRIQKKIGEGGMSFVYLANDVSSNERYAI